MIKHSQAILALEACAQFEVLSVVDENLCAAHLTDVTSSPLSRDSIIQHYSDLFESQGNLPGVIHLDVDLPVSPVQMPLRGLTILIQEQVRLELHEIVNDGVTEPVSEPTPRISALLVVKKASREVRICIDPKLLKKAFKRSHFEMTTLEDVVPWLNNT